jgi:hypothetical protein
MDNLYQFTTIEIETSVKYITEHNLQLTQSATRIWRFSIKWELSFLGVTITIVTD